MTFPVGGEDHEDHGDHGDGRAGLPGWRFDPPGTARGVCLVAPDIYGPSAFYAEIARRLAGEGFTAVLVDYFFRTGPLTASSRDAAFARRERLDEPRALDDLAAALDVLAAEAPTGRVGLVGFCLAGQFALDLCAVRRDLATVCFYPFPEGVAAPAAVPAPRPLDLAADIRGPILSFWGAEDYIPRAVIDRFAAAMAAHGVDYAQRLYDGAGHGFLEGLVASRPDSGAAGDAWARTVAFFGDHLGGTGAGTASTAPVTSAERA